MSLSTYEVCYVVGYDNCLKDTLALRCETNEETEIVINNMRSRDEFSKIRTVKIASKGYTVHDKSDYESWYVKDSFKNAQRAKHVEELKKQGLPESTKVVEKLSRRTQQNQYYYDGWGNAGQRIRLCQFEGNCVCCRRKTYAFTDGGNDPRGPLGDYASSGIDGSEAKDYGYTKEQAEQLEGVNIPACFNCMNEERNYNVVIATMRRRWNKKLGIGNKSQLIDQE